MIADPRRLRGLDDHREMREFRIADEVPETIQTDKSFPDVLVTIEAAALRPFRVVRVNEAQTIETDEAIERGDRLRVAGITHDVVPRREEMTGVEAHANASG